MANNLMSGTLSSIIKEQVESAISKGDTALASAYKTKKFDDCVQALFQGFHKLATGNCAMSGDDALIGSAAIHWYTESNPTIDSIADILKGGTEVLKMETPKTATPTSTGSATKASKPTKPTTTKPATPAKATIPIKQKATLPTAKKATLPTAKPTLPPPPPTPQVVDDDEDFDID